MENNIQFEQCPVCGSKSRLLENLANELKDKGYASKGFAFGYDFRQGVVTDPTKEAAIPIGGSVPAFQITTDICMDCGTIYAIRILVGERTKQIAPPKIIKPGDMPPSNDPRFS